MLPRTLTRSIPGAARSFSTTGPRPLSRVTLIGHLAASPEVVPTKSEAEIVRYTVACNNGTNKPPSWFRVTTFVGPQDTKKKEWMQGLQKGSMLYVEGEISISNYEDGEGHSRPSVNILQRSVEVLKRNKPEDTPAE